MPRKPSNDNNSAPKSASAIKKMRSDIDKLDLQILKLINERTSLAVEIGKAKSDQGVDVFSPEREADVLKNVLSANKGPLEEDTIKAIYREIMSGARAVQKVLKVALLGPSYSFSHLAAIEKFGQAIDYHMVNSIPAVFEQVNARQADFGIVPLENSTDGRVADTLDMFLRLPQIKICAEVNLRIHHNLIANCEPQEIRRVYSKPQALSQCRHWLGKHLPHAAQIAVESTATAADLAKKETAARSAGGGAAAIASRQAAVYFGLKIIFSNIEDSIHNVTRFAVIGHQQHKRTGKDKTAIMFRVQHTPGSLLQVLEIFKDQKLNMTWIESFPIRDAAKGGEYVFFVDFEGHKDEAKPKRALEALEKHCEQLTVLGSFPVGDLVE